MTRGAPVWLAVIALAVSCSGDAPLDGGVADGGADAGFDAGRDAGPRDAGSGPDAGFDAGPDEHWTPVEGLPDGCLVDYTTSADALEGFREEPCPDREGCRRLVPQWRWGLIGFRVEGGILNADPPAFSFTRDGPEALREWWLADRSGQAQFGVRGDPDLCRPMGGHADAERFAIVIQETDGDYVNGWLLGGTWADTEVSVRSLGLVSDLIPRSSFFVLTRVGEQRIGLQSEPAHRIVAATWTGEPTIVAGEVEAGQTYLSASIGDSLFYDVYGDPHSIRVSTNGEPGVDLIVPADGSEAVRILTDGTDMAWIQGRDRVAAGDFGHLELWTSPHASGADDVEPRFVADLDFRDPYPEASIGSGYVTILEYVPRLGNSVLAVYRLSDGARAAIVPPEARGYWHAAAYVTDTEIAVGISRGGPPPQDEAILFVEIDSLDFVVP